MHGNFVGKGHFSGGLDKSFNLSFTGKNSKSENKLSNYKAEVELEFDT